jgi:hypothetical protein
VDGKRAIYDRILNGPPEELLRTGKLAVASPQPNERYLYIRDFHTLRTYLLLFSVPLVTTVADIG